jgi:alanine racemase
MAARHGRPTVAEVSLGALRHNCGEARRLAGDRVRVMAVVKADGYGHGAGAAARAFVEAGASLLGTSTVAEAHAVRAAGVRAPVVVLWGVFEGEIEAVLADDLEPAVWSPDALGALGSTASASGRTVGIHLKVDTGMTRLGLDPADLVAFAEIAARTPGVRIAGVFSHLASADVVETPAVAAQIGRFADAVAALRAAGIDPPDVHLANSAALICRPEARWSVVRPGIMLYGYAPAPHLAARVSLRPALQVVTEIRQVRAVEAGRAVGYAGTWVARRPSRIATLPIGYADGYHRLASNRAELVVRGRRVPIAGRVCMDHVMIDVTDVPDASVGDRVCVVGRQGDVAVWADELGVWCETISYEMLTAVGRRVPRVVMEDFDG